MAPQRKRKFTAASFDPRFKELMLQGSRERVEIPCDDPRQAVRLRHQMNIFRGCMREERLPDADALERCVVRIPPAADGTEGSVVVLEPRGAEFDIALSKLRTSDATPAAPKAAPSLLDEFDVKE